MHLEINRVKETAAAVADWKLLYRQPWYRGLSHWRDQVPGLKSQPMKFKDECLFVFDAQVSSGRLSICFANPSS